MVHQCSGGENLIIGCGGIVKVEDGREYMLAARALR
jgi:dihydroorotate dehydrogenase